jgi:tetratricopeptide (TPR) repeat protein
MFFLFVGVVSALAKSHRHHHCQYKHSNSVENHLCPGGQCPQVNFEKSDRQNLWKASYEAFQDGNPVQAVRYANRLAKLEDSADAYLIQAYMKRATDDSEEAYVALEKCLDRAEAEEADQVLLIDAWTSKAAVYLELGKIKAAEDANRKAYGLAIQQLGEVRDEGSSRDLQVNHYQFACVHAMFAAIEDVEGNKFDARIDQNLAINALQKAIKHGYSNHRHMSTDLDLKALHGDSRFEALLKSIK